MEIGAFEEDIGGGIPHFRICATHDAGQGDGTGCVRDDEHIRSQFPGLSIERFECFILFRGAHNDAVFV